MNKNEFEKLLAVMLPEEPNLEAVRSFLASVEEVPPFLHEVLHKSLKDDETFRLAIHQFRAYCLRQTPLSNVLYSQAVVGAPQPLTGNPI